MDMTGAVAVVTGGASGIGLASARRLTELGAQCLLVDRNPEHGKERAAELGGHFVEADVANEEQVAIAVAEAQAMGPVRVLVNAAGIGNPGRTVDRELQPLPLGKFERVVRVNLIGTFNMIRMVVPAIAATEPLADGVRGAIVNLASVAAFEGQIGQAAYSASKGGIVGMTLPIARDLASLGIRVNTVAPGLIDTPIYGEGEKAEEFKAKLAESALFPRRLGRAEEVASMIIELLTNDYLNGETVRIDAGVRLPPK